MFSCRWLVVEIRCVLYLSDAFSLNLICHDLAQSKSTPKPSTDSISHECQHQQSPTETHRPQAQQQLRASCQYNHQDDSWEQKTACLPAPDLRLCHPSTLASQSCSPERQREKSCQTGTVTNKHRFLLFWFFKETQRRSKQSIIRRPYREKSWTWRANQLPLVWETLLSTVSPSNSLALVS